MDGLGGPMDGLNGLFLFCFIYLINRGGRPTASEKVPFTMTFWTRRLRCPPRLSHFTRLGSVSCSSDLWVIIKGCIMYGTIWSMNHACMGYYYSVLSYLYMPMCVNLFV
jgi:hypothetical protein